MSVKANRVVCKPAARHVVWSAVGTAALSLFGANVYAGNAEHVLQQKTVSYADLDLSQPAGAQVLYARLRGAARQVCGPRGGGDLQRMQLHRACYEKALADAVAGVDKSNVTALHRSNRTIRIAQGAAKTQTGR